MGTIIRKLIPVEIRGQFPFSAHETGLSACTSNY